MSGGLKLLKTKNRWLAERVGFGLDRVFGNRPVFESLRENQPSRPARSAVSAGDAPKSAPRHPAADWHFLHLGGRRTILDAHELCCRRHRLGLSCMTSHRYRSPQGDQAGVILRGHPNRVRTGIESALYDASANSRVEHAAVRPTPCTNCG